MNAVCVKTVVLDTDDMFIQFKIGKKLLFTYRIIDILSQLTNKSNSELKRLIKHGSIDISVGGKVKEIEK